MGKRSNFERRPMDDYPTTDPKAVAALVPFLTQVSTFAEPCAGAGDLVRSLVAAGLECRWQSDLKDGLDAMSFNAFGAIDAIITNPPWTREILHPMIVHFQHIAPTWLLFDADWAHTRQAAPFIDQCSDIVAVGRLKWIPGSKFTGKDNCTWYRFWRGHRGGPLFHAQAETARAA